MARTSPATSAVLSSETLCKSLNELDGIDMGSGPGRPRDYVERGIHEICRLPLSQLTPENLRLALGQGVGLRYFVPLAIEVLAADPFVEGMHFKGDLLVNLLRCPATYWATAPAMRDAAISLADRALKSASIMDDAWVTTILPTIRQELDQLKVAGNLSDEGADQPSSNLDCR